MTPKRQSAGSVDLHVVATELYGLEPASFVAARHARAKEAKATGDRALAAAVEGLRRPSTSAWLANALVRRQPALVDELLALGEEMRRAQAKLDADRLRALSQRRHDLVSELRAAAGSVARSAGTTLSDATVRELDGTFEAAVADADAADQLADGCLAKALRSSGLTGMALLADTEVAPAERRSRGPTTAGSPGRRAGARGAGPADDALRAARANVAERSAGVRSAARRRQAAEQELARRQRARASAEERLALLRTAEAEAGRAVRSAQREVAAADRALRAAQDRLEQAEASSAPGRRR